MAEQKHLSVAELLAADLDTLTTDDIVRRSAIISMEKAARESELANYENEKFQTQKLERVRMREIAIANSEAEREKTRQEQSGCQHKTGGEGLTGFFSGDGAIYGSSTSGLELPTAEIYYMCFRCQKEWHHPKWPRLSKDGKIRTGMREVIDGLITLEEYMEQERAYNEVARWPRKSFAPWNGEFCAASKFNIPMLQNRMAKDNAEFMAYLKAQRGRKSA